MAHTLRHKIGSLLSLWAILINLLPPFISPAQANTESFSSPTPAEVQPAPALIDSQAPLTPAATSPDSILPDWFKSSPAIQVDLSQTAGLTLARPAAIAALSEKPLPETTSNQQPPTPMIEQPAETVLPAWFESSSTRPSLPQENNVQPAGDVLPNWFNPASTSNNQPPLVAEPSASSILPDWFNPGASTPQPPSANFPSLTVPPVRPALAPIPGLQVTVLAPASVSAGNFAGDTYTVTVRNTSALTGFNFSLNANIPATGFTYVPGSTQWTSSISGVITYTDSYTDPLVVWTPNITRNLAPGEVVTLTFRMTTDGAAISGQRLDVNAVYQNPLNSAGSTNGGVNITVGRGNLIVTKSPTIQNGTFGDVITWNIEVANTGLGNVYSATVADIFGSGYTSTNASQLAITPFTMTIGERRNFVVTATVNSCNNLTNTGQAFWSIGNDEGDGTAANPVSDTTDVAYLLGVPSISLSSNSINFGYCAQTPQTVVVTITNAPGAGAARNFRLSSAPLAALPFTVGSLAPGWVYDGAGNFTSTNAILPGQTQVFSFVVTPTATVCGNETSGTIAFTSRFQDACNLAFVGPSISVPYSYGTASASPNLSLTKGATLSGSNVIFEVNFLAQNVQSMSGTIGITDVVPTGLSINSFSSGGLGTITQTGNTLLWAVPPGVGPGNLTGTLRITTTRVGDPDNCNIFTNVATGAVEVTCSVCTAPLFASANVSANANPLTPTIAITASGIQFDHCLIAPQTVVVTVTNSGTGPARNFGLDFSETTPGSLPDEQPFPGSVSTYGITVTAGSPSSGWTYLTPTQRFSYTANGGVISPGQTITFSFVVTPNSSVCGNAGQWEGELLAQYTDACSATLTGPSTLITSTYVETDVPRFGVEKSSTANNPAQVGDIFDYIIDFTARNAQNMSDTVRITDVVPPAFAILGYTGTITAATATLSDTLYSLTGTTVTPAGLVSSTLVTSPDGSATQLVWSAPISNPFATPYTLTGRLTITVQALDLSATCGAYSQYTNQADGSVADACPTCDPLEANASTDVAIEAPTGPPAAAGPKVAVLDGQVCGLITVTNTYSRVFVSDWNQATFTETLGTDDGLPAGTLNYISGTLAVMVDNTDVTTQVTIVQTTPQLVLGFDNVTLIPLGTHNITVAYRLYISDTALSGNASVSPNIRSIFEVTNVGSSGPCGSGDNYSFNTAAPLTIRRADLQLTLATGSAVTCAPISVTLTVADPHLVSNSLVANNVVVTFSVPSTAQLETIAGITYGGALAGNPVTIITGTNVITWIFQNPFTLTTGTISFSMTGSCGSSTLNAGVTFSDRCDVTYGDSASSNLDPLPADVSLFVTPDQFTVNENKANWRIYVTNGGAGTAGRVVITDVLGFGLQYASFTTNYTGQVNLLTTGPFTPGQDVVWEILNLASGQQVRIDIYADVVGCGGLTSDITMNTGCLSDGTCGTLASDSLNFLQPPFAVRSSNAQTADLPFCGTGEVILNVKNSSASAHIYQMVITEALTSLSYVSGTSRVTVTNRAGQIVDGLADIPFEPVTTISGSNIVLLWRLTDPGVTLSQTQILTDRAPEDTVTVRFVVQTECSTPGFNQVQSSAGGLQSCGTFFFRDESAVTLDTIEPDISLVKEGLNVTKGDTTYTTHVIGEPGDVIVWRVQAVNATSANIAQNVIVTDTLPSNMNQAAPTASSASGTITTTTGLVTWNIGSLPADGVDRTLFITTTIDAEPTACQSTFTNTAILVYGCDNGCLAELITATANLRSQPLISAQVLNTASLNTCGGLITVTLTNNGLPVYDVTLTDTIPSGYVYDSTVFSSTTPSVLPTDGVTTAVWAWTGGISLPTGVTTLTFRVRNNSSTGTCAPTSVAPNAVAISYDDNPACTASGPYTASDSSTINTVAPTLVVDKSPATRVANAGQVVTWTVTVQNTGTGDATGVSVTDTIGSGFNGIVAGNGSDADETSTPTIVGSVITWTPVVTIAAGDTWRAVVTATLAADGTGIPTNTVEASGVCTSGCNYVSGITDTAFVTLLTNFDKAPSVQTGTIGSLAVFTFTTSLPDFDALYQNLTITDALPSGLGYVASVVAYISDGDNAGGTTLISTTPTLSPAFAQNGNVVWNLGDVPGAVLVNGVITTVIQNIAGNQGGINRTNSLNMTYLDNGQSYNFTDTAQVNIAEPILHLSKSYVTSSGCNATLLLDNFNDNDATGWTQIGGGWSVVNGIYQNNSDATNRRSFNGNLAWTDYSFSAMMRSSDVDEIGLLFRAQNDNTSFYRFQWRQRSGATMGQRLERVNSGTATPLAFNATPYISGQWYHVEIRAEGSRLRVFVDEQLIFDVTDTAFAAGRTGLYANNENAAFFDDVLVTRLDQQGCLVGANDLVTYTLLVSNQGQLPGYDLVITDAIPTGMSLVNSSLQSDDPASILTAAPTPPVPGAANLIWNINQLTSTLPFNPLAHPALTITVVLRVPDGITANTTLSNQAFLSYDNWSGSTSPTTITRNYSGGSHSTAVRTIDGALAKTVTFDPPPTATLGSLVTYTLIVPASPITATLYNVVITDQLNTPRFFIESVTTGGGTGGSASFNQATGQITATFASVPHDIQAFVTVTTRISDSFPSPATDIPSSPGPDVVTNSAVLTHSSSTVITTSNVVTTNVGEPQIIASKTAAVLSANQQTAIYTITALNTGNSPAYNLLITDNLPTGIVVTTISDGGQVSPDGRTLTWAMPVSTVLLPGASLALTYTVQLSQPIYSTNLFTNTALVRNTSLTDTIPGTRTFTSTTVNTFTWPLVSLGNFVWFDTNNNGLTDTGEVGVPGVAVELYQDSNGDGQYTPGVDGLISTTATVAGGFYSFTNLLPSLSLTQAYLVVITSTNFSGGGVLAGYFNSDGSAGGNSDLNSQDHGVVTGTLGSDGFVASTPVSLTVGTEPTNDGDADASSNLTIDFGFYRLSLGDQVWFDTNNNALLDGGEIGVPSITVRLYDSTGTTVLSTTTTDAGGFYTFTNLFSGTYIVEIVPPVTFTSSTDITSSINPDNNVNSDDNGVNLTPTGTIRSNPVVLTPGSSGAQNQNTVTHATGSTHNPTVDFGLVQMVAIGNIVWIDDGAGSGGVANNGRLDGSEVGVNGVEVQLYRQGQTSGVDTPVLTTTTSGGGYYQFDNLTPGQYFVHIPASEFGAGQPLVGYVSSTGVGSDETTDHTGDENGIDSFTPITTGISSQVYNLQPDTEITGEDQSNYTGTLDNDNVNFTADFGFVQAVAIGNIIWIDNGMGGGTANNGRLDGTEAGVNGVEVQLYRQGQTPGVATPVLTTTTAGGGFYQFDNLTPGQYFVHIPASEFGAGQPLVGYVSSTGSGADETTDQTGDENGIDSFTPITTGISSQVYNLQPDTEVTGEDQPNYTGTLDDNNVNFTADFGFVQAVAIGNIVWIDDGAGGGTANNGRRDGAEAGVNGVEIHLYRQGQTPGMDTPVLTTTTSGGGFYQFDNLTPGQYFIHIPASEFGVGQPLSGFLSSTGSGNDETTDHTGDENGIDSLAPTSTGINSQVYDLQPDTEVTGEGQGNYTGTLDDNNVNFTADFSFVSSELVAIGNIVWIDNGAGSGGVANNGRLDGTEAGVDGVEVQLYRQGQAPGVDTPVLTTTTSGGGFYQFDNLTPGQYFVHIPASEFGGGQPLVGYVSSTGAGNDETTDHTGDENGIDSPTPASTGISSQVYNLQPNSEASGESQSNYTGSLDDDNVNFTADFGFHLQPVLHLDKRVSPTGTISPGQRLDYTLCFSNSGSLTATNIVITDFVPFNTTFVPGSVIVPAPAVVEYQDNGGAFGGTEPITTTGLRWSLANLAPGGNTCVGFSVQVNLTISDTASGLAVMASPLGWIVLEGDTSGMPIITRTLLATPTIITTPTVTPTETPVITPTVTTTPEITSTPEITDSVTPTPAPTPEVTPMPVITETATATPPATAAATPVLLPTETPTAAPVTETPVLTSTETLLPTETPTEQPPAETAEPTATATETPIPTESPTDTPTPVPPTLEPTPIGQAVIPSWFLASVSMLAASGLFGQLTYQSQITATGSVEPTMPPQATVEPIIIPPVTTEPTNQPVTDTPAATTLPEETVTPIATLTGTTEATPAVSPTSEPTTAPTGTVVPSETVLPTPEITATVSNPVASGEYVIVPFDTMLINIPNVATISSDQTPIQTDVVTTPLIRIIDPLLTKEVNPSQASPGDLVYFTITVDNPAPPSNANATNLVVVDPLPYNVDLVNFSASSVPSGLVGNIEVITAIVPIVGHPLGINQATATTLTLFIPLLGPNQRVVLNLTTRVNNLASPPPQTIRNVALLTFTEGDAPPVQVSVDVPIPNDHHDDNDNNDDDDNNNVPTPSAPMPTVPPAVVQVIPTLPALFLPETGFRESQSDVRGRWLLLPLLLGIVALIGLGSVVKRKR